MNIKIKSIWQVNSTEKSQNNVPFARAYILESTGLSTSQWELLYGFRVGLAIFSHSSARAELYVCLRNGSSYPALT